MMKSTVSVVIGMSFLAVLCSPAWADWYIKVNGQDVENVALPVGIPVTIQVCSTDISVVPDPTALTASGLYGAMSLAAVTPDWTTAFGTIANLRVFEDAGAGATGWQGDPINNMVHMGWSAPNPAPTAAGVWFQWIYTPTVAGTGKLFLMTWGPGWTTTVGTWDTVSITAYQKLQPDPLLGYWNFEEGAPQTGGTSLDRSGKAPSLNVELRSNAKIQWDADRQSYVLNPRPGQTSGESLGGAKTATGADISKLNANDAVTMSVWVKPTSSQGISEQNFLIAGDTTGNAHRLFSQDSGMSFACQEYDPDGGGWNPATVWRGRAWDPADQNYDGTGPWHHLLVTCDGTYYYAYVDGVLHATKKMVGTTLRSFPNDAQFGIARTSSSTGTTHLIDDVAIFRGYMTPASVTGLYNGTYTVFNVPVYAARRAVPECTGQNPGDANLVAWYHMEDQGAGGAGTTNDLAADFPAVDGVLQNGAPIVFNNGTMPFQPSLKVGKVLQSTDNGTYDGGASEDTHIAMTGAKFNNVGSLSGGFTLMAWINPDDYAHQGSGQKSWGIIASKGGYYGSYCLYYENGGITAVVMDQYNNQNRVDSWADKIIPGQWHHVAMVFKPGGKAPDGVTDSEINLYIDGKLVNKNYNWFSDGDYGLRQVGYPFMVSGDGWKIDEPEGTPDYVNRAFRGKIDDVRLYNRALTDEELRCAAYRNCVPRLVFEYGEMPWTNDCAVNLWDVAVLSNGWLAQWSNWGVSELANIASHWLETDLIYPVY